MVLISVIQEILLYLYFLFLSGFNKNLVIYGDSRILYCFFIFFFLLMLLVAQRKSVTKKSPAIFFNLWIEKKIKNAKKLNIKKGSSTIWILLVLIFGNWINIRFRRLRLVVRECYIAADISFFVSATKCGNDRRF